MNAEKKCRRITRKEQKIARGRSHKILSDVQKTLREKGYRFSWCIAGSGHWGTMIEDTNGKYDLDYQILLTENSRCFKNDVSPEDIKTDFFNAFEKNLNEDERLENSTTAITLRNNPKTGKKFSVDFVIIRADLDQIIRRNGQNQYTWNKLPSKYKDTYRYFKNLSIDEKQTIIEKIIKRKCIEKRKPDGKSSSEIMMEEINKYARE